MNGFSIGFRREFRSLVFTPLVWGAAAAVAIPAGMGFAFGGLVAGSVADIARSIGISLWCVGVAACALAARSIPSERRSGTWDLTLASPINVATIVHAKFVALTLAGAICIAPIFLQAFTLATVSSPSWSVILCGALGLWLLIVAATGVGLLVGVVVRSTVGSIVASLTFIAAWIALCRGGQSLSWPMIASAAFTLDPLRRAEDFTRGTLDFASAAALLAVGVGCAWCAGAWAQSDAEKPSKGREISRVWMCLGVLAAIISSVIALRGAGAPAMSIEAVSLMSGSLQESTKQIIAQSKAPMNITLLSAKGNSDALALRHARRILAQASREVLADGSSVHCQEFDFLELADAQKSAALFEMIEASEAKNVEAWRESVTKGVQALASIAHFSEAASGQIQTLMNALGQDDSMRSKLQVFAAAINKTARDGSQVRDSITQLATPTAERPLGNAEGAGRKLANELNWWSGTLQETADGVGNCLQKLPPALSTIARQLQRNCAAQAEQAKAAQDRIDQLAPLRASDIAAAMQFPPTLIVSSANDVAAIPAWQMHSSVSATELALAEAIRCVAGAPRLSVTIVHSQLLSPLDSTPSGGDLSFIVQALRAARIDVDQWNPSKGAAPLIQSSKRVWIVMPPLDRSAQEPDSSELALLQATRMLLERGERVLITATPNPFASMGISDPWADLLQFAGLRAKSGQVVLDLGAKSENANELRGFIEFSGSASGHPAALAATNQSIMWPMPIPIEMKKQESWTATAIEFIPPSAQRWIENDPRVVSRSMEAAPSGKMFSQPVPVLVVAERDDGMRVALAGGLSWLLTLHSGMTDRDQQTIHAPGNRDVAISVIRWLAGSDSISTVPDTGRIPELSTSLRIIMSIIALVIIPMCLAFTGRSIYKSRRHA